MFITAIGRRAGPPRLRAALIHLGICAAIAGLLLLLVTRLWYPPPLFELAEGGHIFVTLVACDVTIGPFLTFLVFNVQKSRGQLARDLAVIALIQLGALAYGVSTLMMVRPVYIVYSAGHFAVTLANETATFSESNDGTPPFYKRWLGPQLVGVKLPGDREDRRRLLKWAIEQHVGISQLPNYFVPYSDIQAEAKKEARSLAQIAGEVNVAPEVVSQSINELPTGEIHFGFLPLMIRDTVALAVIDSDTGRLVAIKPIRGSPKP